MTAGSKLSIALVVALLTIGLIACGGDDDSGSTATTTDAPAQNAAGSDSTSGEDEDEDSGSESSESVGSEDFAPRQHDDSGGGSDQYTVRGGDNSVQEFGAEADEAERDAAATAVHNFLDARAQEAWEAACSYVSTDVRESLEMLAAKAQEAAEEQGKSVSGDTGCTTILAGLTTPAALPQLRKEAAAADVRSLRVEGDQAFVIYTGVKGTVTAIPVVEEDGEWKVASLAGTPIL